MDPSHTQLTYPYDLLMEKMDEKITQRDTRFQSTRGSENIQMDKFIVDQNKMSEGFLQLTFCWCWREVHTCMCV